MAHPINRRELIKNLALGTLAVGLSPGSIAIGQEPQKMSNNKNPIRHSVARWCYGFLPLEELCELCNSLQIEGIDLIGPKEWHLLKKNNIDSSMCNGAEIGLEKGWNDPQYHEVLIKNYTEHIDLVAQAGYKNLICFSGNRNGMDDETGMKNCVDGLKKILSHAERKGVIIQMELFNSLINHPDYMCDKSAWGIELCKQLDSANFKLLYDIYHMQINEGNIINTIRDHHMYFGHYHTAGVPGRNEIDETQELHYPAIIRAISKTGFSGYVAQEFLPTGKTKEDKIEALKKAIEICTI